MTSIDCERARSLLQDPHEERLAQADRDALEAHVASCAACRQLRASERVLSELLQTRLQRPVAPAALRAKIAALASAVDEGPAPPPAAATVERAAPGTAATVHTAGRDHRRKLRWGLPAAMAVAAAALWVVLQPGPLAPVDPLVVEAVNDHLRVVYAERPLEVERGGMHQVRPWFTGRLDFAPVLNFDGDAEFELSGGSVGYFIDRKAAVFVFKHRLHTISLLEFRAAGLRWPSRGHAPDASPVQARRDGFNVLWWRDGDLGFALVSDAQTATLQRLSQRLTATR